MSCQKRDPDLLLLTHRELGGLRRFLLEAHLRRCPRCQEQGERYAGVAGLVAGAIRGERLPAWSLPVPGRRHERADARPLSWSLAVALLLALASLATAAALWVPALMPPADPHRTGLSAGTAGCGTCHSQLPANHPRALPNLTPVRR